MGKRMLNDQDSQKKKRLPDFGELPDLDDLLLMADIDDGDVSEAVQWLEDNAPDAAKKVSGTE